MLTDMHCEGCDWGNTVNRASLACEARGLPESAKICETHDRKHAAAQHKKHAEQNHQTPRLMCMRVLTQGMRYRGWPRRATSVSRSASQLLEASPGSETSRGRKAVCARRMPSASAEEGMLQNDPEGSATLPWASQGLGCHTLCVRPHRRGANAARKGCARWSRRPGPKAAGVLRSLSARPSAEFAGGHALLSDLGSGPT